MSARKQIVYCLVIFGMKIAKAQNPPDYDTNYIVSYRDYLIITAVSTVQTNSLTVADLAQDGVVFKTNNPTAYGFAVDYKWLTAEYTSSFNNTIGDPRYGQTEAQTIGFGLTGRKFWFRNFYQRFQGYYLENPWYYEPNFDRMNALYPHRNDVVTSTYFANLNYGFNHQKFSNMASLWQIERQKKSAGSFTVGASYARIGFGADSALIPSHVENFPDDARITRLSFHLLGINGGYLHTFAIGKKRKWFVSLALIPGLNMQVGNVEVENGNGTVQKSSLGSLSEARIVFGYNGDKWYITSSGITYNVVNRYSEEAPMSNLYSTGRFVVGYRFKMRETRNEFLKKIGL